MFRPAENLDQRAGSVFFHLGRDPEHIEGVFRKEPLHEVAEPLGVHVVHRGFEDRHWVAENPLTRRKPRLKRLAQNQPQKIGPGIEPEASRPVARTPQDHRRQRPETGTQRSHDRRSRGGGELGLDIHPVGRHPFEDLLGRGRRDRDAAVTAGNKSPAVRDRRGIDRLHFQVFEAERAPHHIHQRIHGADLVKVDLLRGAAVNGGLGHRKSAENRHRPLPDDLRIGSGGDELAELAETTVRRGGIDHPDLDAPAPDSVFGHRLLLDLEAVDRKSAKPLPQPVQRHAEIDERPEGHVPAHTGKTVEVKDPVHPLYFPLRRLIDKSASSAKIAPRSRKCAAFW